MLRMNLKGNKNTILLYVQDVKLREMLAAIYIVEAETSLKKVWNFRRSGFVTWVLAALLG